MGNIESLEGWEVLSRTVREWHGVGTSGKFLKGVERSGKD